MTVREFLAGRLSVSVALGPLLLMASLMPAGLDAPPLPWLPWPGDPIALAAPPMLWVMATAILSGQKVRGTATFVLAALPFCAFLGAGYGTGDTVSTVASVVLTAASAASGVLASAGKDRTRGRALLYAAFAFLTIQTAGLFAGVAAGLSIAALIVSFQVFAMARRNVGVRG